MEEMQGEWLPVSAAARIAGCSPAWLRRLGDAGRVQMRATPLGRLFLVADVERLGGERVREAGR